MLGSSRTSRIPGVCLPLLLLFWRSPLLSKPSAVAFAFRQLRSGHFERLATVTRQALPEAIAV